MRKLIAIVGPTGSGKTALAVALAKKFNGVIISADSRQVYRDLDVGTNKEGVADKWQKLPARFMADIPQLLVDIVSPAENFTLNDWLTQARYALECIFKAGKLPIVVGGTGLYVSALLEGYQPGGGRYAKERQEVNFESLILLPKISREILYQKSNERYERIFDDLIAETKKLIKSGVNPDWLVKLGLDYRWATLYILGQRHRELAISEFQQASRQYIRRQLTWWRHHGQPILIESDSQALSKTKSFLG